MEWILQEFTANAVFGDGAAVRTVGITYQLGYINVIAFRVILEVDVAVSVVVKRRGN